MAVKIQPNNVFGFNTELGLIFNLELAVGSLPRAMLFNFSKCGIKPRLRVI
ncbi:hypothetical protein PTRA_a0427 [Pseudoalteromonas translucida KMM 520]|uniref:Uncharacterized protein n=1 Tax=Pseudoalteromonas translucida KMM 520 TaxID=1315283 RepID=A0A0U2WW20_9GAMM|nr:hypothetical protein PTRA_a0427 [Pseudoalteromonas translucida KMM 520]